MNWKLLKEQKPLLALIIVSIAIIPSIFMGPRTMGIVFLLYIVVITWCLISFFGKAFLKDTFMALVEKEEVAREKNKHITSVFYGIAIPLISFGILVLLVNICLLIFVL